MGVLNHFRTTVPNPLIVGDLHRNPLRYWLALRHPNARIVHYHHARWSTLIATAISLSSAHRPASVISVHGHELERSLDSPLRPVAWLTRRALRSFDVVVAVSPEVARTLERSIRGKPITVVPAYLPDRADEHAAGLSARAEAFIKAGQPTLIAAAYRLTTEASGKTTYGLEFALDVFIALADDYPTVRLAIFLAQGPRNRRERARLEQLRSRSIAAGVDDRLHISVGEPLSPAFSYDCIFLRPSITDGDAVAVREALAAGVPVIASDVVQRPPGVKALPLERLTWAEAVVKVDPNPQRDAPPERASAHADALVDIYLSLLSP